MSHDVGALTLGHPVDEEAHSPLANGGLCGFSFG